MTDTDERINVEKLKQKEKILFYQDFTLYEDELHDNGIASCSVKIVSNFIFYFLSHMIYINCNVHFKRFDLLYCCMYDF